MKRDSRSHESSEVVGVRGFEPPTPCSQRRSPNPATGSQVYTIQAFSAFRPSRDIPSSPRKSLENRPKNVRSELPAPPQDGLGFAVRLPPAFALTVVRLLHLEPGERAPFLVRGRVVLGHQALIATLPDLLPCGEPLWGESP